MRDALCSKIRCRILGVCQKNLSVSRHRRGPPERPICPRGHGRSQSRGFLPSYGLRAERQISGAARIFCGGTGLSWRSTQHHRTAAQQQHRPVAGRWSNHKPASWHGTSSYPMTETSCGLPSRCRANNPNGHRHHVAAGNIAFALDHRGTSRAPPPGPGRGQTRRREPMGHHSRVAMAWATPPHGRARSRLEP